MFKSWISTLPDGGQFMFYAPKYNCTERSFRSSKISLENQKLQKVISNYINFSERTFFDNCFGGSLKFINVRRTN